jgi:hypothetical protein
MGRTVMFILSSNVSWTGSGVGLFTAPRASLIDFSTSIDPNVKANPPVHRMYTASD